MLLFATGVQAAWDETVDGDFSDDPSAPTAIAISAGTNTIAGGSTFSPLDRDFFTVILSSDQTLVSILLSRYELSGNPDDGGSLLALEAGPVISDPNTGAGLTGFEIVGVSAGTQVGDELIDILADGPLGEGTYTFWTQNTGADTAYVIDLEVVELGPPIPPRTSSIPVLGPAGLAMMILILAGVAIRRLRQGAHID